MTSTTATAPLPFQWQQSVIDRVTEMCTLSHGMMLFHKMGSGKTISALGIIKNQMEKNPEMNAVIFVPASIMSTYSRQSGDVQLIAKMKTSSGAKQMKWTADKLMDRIRVHPIRGRPAKGSKNRSLEDLAADPSALAQLIRGKIVCVDEVHNLALLMQEGATSAQASARAQRIQHAFQQSAKVVLLTGTPVIRSMVDLSCALSLVDNCTQWPMTDSDFKREFYVQSSADRAKLTSDFNKLLIGQTAYGVTKNQGYAMAMSSLSVGPAGLPLAVASFLAWFSITLKFDEWGFNQKEEFLAGVRMQQYLSVDESKIKQQMAGSISFFDYETAEGNSRFSFPRKQINEINIPYTEAQTEMIFAIYDRSHYMSRDERARIGFLSQESADSADDRRKYSLRLGSLSDYPYFLGFPQLSTDGTYTMGVAEEVLQQHQAILDRYKDYKKHGPDRDMTAGEMYDISESMRLRKIDYNKELQYHAHAIMQVPRFQQALSILERYATDPAAHEVAETPTPSSIKAFYKALTGKPRATRRRVQYLGKPSDSQAWAVTTGQKLTGKYNSTKRFLPVVAFAFEETMREFGYFLTLKKKRFVVISNTYSQKDVRPAVQPYAYGENEPVCVLLHPDVREGLSLTFNPCMIMMEMIDGYGIQEQVRARVLRGFKSENKFTKDEQRPLKLIYQFSGVSTPNYSKLKAERSSARYDRIREMSLDKTSKALAYKDKQRVEQQLAAQKAKWKTLTTKEKFEVSKIWLAHQAKRGRHLASSLVTSKPSKLAYQLFSSLFGQEYEATQWLEDFNPLPEKAVAISNESQSRVLENIAQIFVANPSLEQTCSSCRRCAGKNKDGTPCQRFVRRKYCHDHAEPKRKPNQKKVRFRV